MLEESMSKEDLMHEISKLQMINRELENQKEEYKRICFQIVHANPERYKSKLEAMASVSDVFFTLDSDWRFTYISPAISKYWKQSPEERLGQVIWEVLPQYKNHPVYGKYIRAMQERIPYAYEYYDQERRSWLEISLYPLEGGGLSCFCKDINAFKRNEQAIKTAQQNAMLRSNELQTVINVVPASILIARDPECKVIVGNEYTYEMTGEYIPMETNISLSVPEGAWPYHMKLMQNGQELAVEEMPVQRAAAGEIIQDMEFQLCSEDGSVRTMLGNAVPIFNSEGITTGAVAAFIDISERKQAEQRLLCQNAVLDGINRIFEYALFSSCKKDLARFCLEITKNISKSQYGFIGEININRKMESLAISLAANELCQIESDKKKSINNGLNVKGIYRSVLSCGRPLFSNEPAVHPDFIGLPAGHPPITSFMGIPLMNKGKTIGMIGLANREGGYTEELMTVLEPLANAIVQVLARLKDQMALEALQASDERYRSLTERLLKANLAQSEDRFYKTFHHNPNMMIIINLNDNSIIEVNQAALDTFDFTREEIIGNTVAELGIFLVEREILSGFQQELQRYGKLKNIELNAYAKSGQKISLLLSAILINFNKEKCSLMIMNDISARKHYEKELARLDRLNLIGEMAASIGHEIRNPMTSVRGFLQMFNAQDDVGDKRPYYDLMIEELDRANSIITEFLSMARNKTSNLQPLFLNKLIRSIQPMMQAEANLKGNDLKLLLESSSPLMLDKNEIRQMILNMFCNALEAMPEGGEVTICTQVTDKGTLLLIKDQGAGIDPEYLDRIGTPFVSSKENGTGLGLAVCYSIAARHGAEIDFETGPEGTTFIVHFPRMLKRKLIS